MTLPSVPMGMLTRIRILVAELLLLTGAATIGWELVSFPKIKLLLCFGPPGLALLVTAYGLARGRSWGRWSGLAIGVSGLWFMSSGMVLHGDYHLHLLLVTAAFGLLTLCLLGRSMSERFEADPRAGCPLRAQGPRVQLLRWGAIFSLSALPWLWLATVEHPSTVAALAGLAAATVLVGTVLLFRQRLAGALLIVLAIIPAASLVVHTLVTPRHGLSAGEFFCASNFGLAIFGAALVLAGVAGPVGRFLRS